MPQICLIVNLTKHGNPVMEVKYLHGTREILKDAEELCQELNDQLLNARYRVVEDES